MGVRRTMLAFAAAVIVTAGMAVVAIVGDDLDEQLLLTAVSFSLYGLLAVPGVRLLEQRRERGLAAVLLVAVAVAQGLVVAVLWGDPWVEGGGAGDGLVDAWTCATALALALCQIAATAPEARDAPAVEALRWAATVLAAAAATLVCVVLLGRPGGEALRLIGVLLVLDVLFLWLRPVVRRLAVRG